MLDIIFNTVSGEIMRQSGASTIFCVFVALSLTISPTVLAETAELVVKLARVQIDRGTGTVAIYVTLDAAGALAESRITTAHVGELVDVLVDDTVVARPRVLMPIRDGTLIIQTGALVDDTQKVQNARQAAARLSSHKARLRLRTQ
jgi:preprotein translocase subunit SecD